MQIALFGGSFDPPHLGHRTVAETLLLQQFADEVWFVPLQQHPLGKVSTPDHHRVAMLDLMADKMYLPIRVELYEVEKGGKSFTHETLEYMTEQFPDDTFSWVIGSDNLASYQKWAGFPHQLSKFQFYVYPRAGFEMEPLYDWMEPLEDVEEVKISSTQIRERAERGESLAGLVTPEVEQYITDHQLYQKA